MAFWEEPMEVEYAVADGMEQSILQEGFSVVDLENENPEFISCAQQFHDTMTRRRAKILHVVRINNPSLWQKFVEKKTTMEVESDGWPLREFQLFHGTSRNAIVSICRDGFDPNRCGKHGTKYGKGCYFARDASFSHMYTDQAADGPGATQWSQSVVQYLHYNRKKHPGSCLIRSPTGVPLMNLKPFQTMAEESVNGEEEPTKQHTHFMFLARVLVGRFTQGTSSMTKPPETDPRNPSGHNYDSCTDSVFGPRIFTVFDSAQCYPEYVLEYTNEPSCR